MHWDPAQVCALLVKPTPPTGTLSTSSRTSRYSTALTTSILRLKLFDAWKFGTVSCRSYQQLKYPAHRNCRALSQYRTVWKISRGIQTKVSHRSSSVAQLNIISRPSSKQCKSFCILNVGSKTWMADHSFLAVKFLFNTQTMIHHFQLTSPRKKEQIGFTLLDIILSFVW